MTRTRRPQSIGQHGTAAALAAITSLALLSAVVDVADGYRADAEVTAAALMADEPAAQQVVIVGKRVAPAASQQVVVVGQRGSKG